MHQLAAYNSTCILLCVLFNFFHVFSLWYVEFIFACLLYSCINKPCFYNCYCAAFISEWLRAWDTLAMMKLWRREVVSAASMAEWLRAWDTMAMMKLWRREVVSSASMAEWVRAGDTLAVLKLWRREVVSSIPDRGTVVGWVFSPTRQLVRFSHLNVPSFQNSEFIWNVVPVGKQ